VTAKLTVDDAASCVAVAAIVARIEQVPTVFKRPTDTDDCFDKIDIIATEPIEHTSGVSDDHEIAPPPADGAAVSPGPTCVTKYDDAAPVIDNVRVVGATVVVGAAGGGVVAGGVDDVVNENVAVDDKAVTVLPARSVIAVASYVTQY
jgi:hypothetical protein